MDSGERLSKRIELTPMQLGTLAVYAVRYAAPRLSYAASEVVSLLRPLLKDMLDNDLRTMARDLRDLDGATGQSDDVRQHWLTLRIEVTEELWRRGR